MDKRLWYGIGILYDHYVSIDHAEEAFSCVFHIDKGQPSSIAINLMFVLSQEIPMHFAGFSIEAGVDNAMTMWVRVWRMTNSVSRSFLKLFSWY